MCVVNGPLPDEGPAVQETPLIQRSRVNTHYEGETHLRHWATTLARGNLLPVAATWTLTSQDTVVNVLESYKAAVKVDKTNESTLFLTRVVYRRMVDTLLWIVNR